MSDIKQDHRLVSKGTFSGHRIGRPVVVYDQRTKFAFDLSDYERTMNERKKIGYSEVEDKTPATSTLTDD